MFKIETGYDYGKVLSCLHNNTKNFTIRESRLVDKFWDIFDIQCELTQLDEYNFNLVYGDQETNIILVQPIGMERKIWIEGPKYKPGVKSEYLGQSAYRVLWHLDCLRILTGDLLVATISKEYAYTAYVQSNGDVNCFHQLFKAKNFLAKRYEVSEHAKSECNLLGSAVWVQQ